MNKDVFFDFGSKLILATFQSSPIGLKKDKNGIDGDLKLIDGNYSEINFPIIFKQKSGKKLRDLLDTGFPSLYLISDKMKTILEENHLTGWKSYPIQLYDKKGNELFGYHGFSITGRCDPIDYEKSSIIEKQFVTNGPICKYYKGIFIDGWDGSDFFMPKHTSQMIVTKKTADILKKYKLTNISLKNLADYEEST